MSLFRYRFALLFALIGILMFLGALGYQSGMERFEGERRSFWRALAWSVETLTTTGYGADAVWSHPAMVLFVAVFQFLGVFVVFLIVPLYLIPFLEARFQARLPVSVPMLEGHLIVYGSGPSVAAILQTAEEHGLPVLVIEEDEGEARRLLRRGVRVLFSRLEDGALAASHLLRARALIANSSDERDAAVIIAARQMGFQGDILALAEEPFHRQPLVLAGATAVFTPCHVLGAALAARASDRISPQLSGPQRIGRLQVRYLRLRAESALAGRTLREAAIGAQTGATVIGQWVGGNLRAPLTADMSLEPNAILVVVGTEESVAKISELCAGAVALPRVGPFVVGGYGEVGRKVVELLRDADEEVYVVDRIPGDGVDVVGDLVDPEILERLRLESARAIILALDNDSATLFATVILKDRFPEVPVIARVNEADNVDRIHRAGADFALSVSLVSGQILARRLLGEESVTIDNRLKVLKTGVGALSGQHLGGLPIRRKTGCSIIAVERGEEVLVDLGADFRFLPEDQVYVCGSDSAVKRFVELFR